MAGKDNLTPYTKNDNRASNAGKKSKRGPSIKKQWEEILKSNLPANIKNHLKNLQGSNGESLKKTVFALNAGKALALSVLSAALSGEGWAAKLIVESIDGKAHQSIELSGDPEKPINYNIMPELLSKGHQNKPNK